MIEKVNENTVELSLQFLKPRNHEENHLCKKLEDDCKG